MGVLEKYGDSEYMEAADFHKLVGWYADIDCIKASKYVNSLFGEIKKLVEVNSGVRLKFGLICGVKTVEEKHIWNNLRKEYCDYPAKTGRIKVKFSELAKERE